MHSNRFISFFRRALLAVALIGTFALTSCDNDDEDPIVEEPTVYDGSILDLLQDDDYKQATTGSAANSFDSLVKYLTVHSELTTKLDGTAEYTFFAPSNEAFINLLNTPNFPQDIGLISPELIKNVLSYHIVAGKKLKADLTSGTTLNSEFTDPLAPGAAQTITVNSNGTLMAAPNATNVDIDITTADLETNNGVIHIVESVMIPPSTGQVLVPILGTVAGTVLLGKDFSNLAKVIMSADAGYTEVQAEGKFKVATMLAMPIDATNPFNMKGITFFALPNEIQGNPFFTSEAADTLIAMEDHGRSWLLNHLVNSGQYTVADPPATNPNEITKFTTGAIEAASGAMIYVSVSEPSTQSPYGVALSTSQEPATFRPIVLADLSHNNGVIHVFAGSLQ